MPSSARKTLEALAREQGLDGVRIVRGPRTAFRHRARLAVRGRATSPKIGIFETGSHRVVDIPRCLVHHARVNEVAAEVRRAMVATVARGTTPYSDDAHRGLVRYVQVVVERRSQTAQVVVVTRDDSPQSSEPLCNDLAARLGPRLHSLFWNGNPDRTNTILGPHWKKLSGPSAIEETIGGARVFYPPGAFGQSNLDLADAIVETVHAAVPDGHRVAELYAGVGPIGLGLVHRSRHVAFNEVGTESLRGLALGIAALPEADRGRTEVVEGPARDALSLVRKAEVMIVDPPRKGLEHSVRDELARAPFSRLIYVSCGLSSFLEDTAALLQTRTLVLADLVAFDLFPHTEHVEIVARFDRVGG